MKKKKKVIRKEMAGLWIPKAVLNNKLFSNDEKILLAYIITWSHKNLYCSASNLTLAQKINKSERTVKRYLNKLNKLNFTYTTIKQVGAIKTDRRIFLTDEFKNKL